jgi:hypothetical protein
MKKFKDLKKIQEGKYQVFSGETKYNKISLFIIDYNNYGDPQVILKKDDLNWIEIPGGLSGIFTHRNGKPHNSCSFNLDKYYKEKYPFPLNGVVYSGWS